MICIEKKYYQWIDALKGFGIIAVTVGHLNPCMTIEKHIYSFHMPLFFFISGFLFACNTATVKSYIYKKVQGILVPFVVWDSISTILAILLGANIHDAITRFFIVDGKLCWNAPIWFLLILFLVEFIYALTIILSKDHAEAAKTTIFILSGTLWIVWWLCGSQNYSLKLNLIPFATFFFVLGDFSKSIRFFDCEKWLQRFFIAVFGAICITFGAFFNIRVSYTGGKFGNICTYIVAAISGTMFYFFSVQEFQCNWMQ